MMDVYTLTDPDLQEYLNVAKEQTIAMLVREKILTEEQASDFLGKYAIVITKRKSLGSQIAKLFGIEEKGTRFVCVKLI